MVNKSIDILAAISWVALACKKVKPAIISKWFRKDIVVMYHSILKTMILIWSQMWHRTPESHRENYVF